MNWFLIHWPQVLTAASGVVTAASVIAKITPTPKDDAWVAKAVKVLDFLALNTSRGK